MWKRWLSTLTFVPIHSGWTMWESSVLILEPLSDCFILSPVYIVIVCHTYRLHCRCIQLKKRLQKKSKIKYSGFIEKRWKTNYKTWFFLFYLFFYAKYWDYINGSVFLCCLIQAVWGNDPWPADFFYLFFPWSMFPTSSVFVSLIACCV